MDRTATPGKHHMRAAFFALLSVTTFAADALASGPTIGPLCIDGVTATPHPELASPREGGVWTPTDYSLDPAQARTAKLTVFDKAIPPSNRFETCRDVLTRMANTGSRPVLSGTLRALTLRALVFEGPAGNRIQVNRGSFTATLGRVESGSRPVIGGQIDFRGSELWIHPSEDIVVTSGGIEGELEIEAWNRKIVGANISIGPAFKYVTSLVPRRETNITVRLNLQDGQARLWAGDLVGAAPAGATGDLNVPALFLKGATLQAASVNVLATNGQLDTRIVGMKGSSDEVLIPGPQLDWRMTNALLTIDLVDGRADQQPDMLTVAHAAFRTVSIPKAHTEILSHAPVQLFDGTAETTFAALSEASRSATSSWTNVSSVALGTMCPTGIARMRWHEAGPTSALIVDGTFDIDRLKLAGIDLVQPISLVLARSPLLADIAIPVKIDLPAANGRISFLNGDQTVAIQGRLTRLSIDGMLVIPVLDIAMSRLEVKYGKLQIGVATAVSISPVVAGAKPNFIDGTLSVVNNAAITVSRVNSVGTALLTAHAVVLAQPVLQVGDNGTKNPSTVDFKSEGDATLQYDLAVSTSTLVKAKLTATDVAFSLLGPEPRILDLGGNRISDPTATIKSIAIEVDQLSLVRVERAQIDNLRITAGRVTKVRSDGADTGLEYSGALASPLTLETARAGRVSVSDALVLSDFELDVLDVSMTDSSVSLGAGISFAHGFLGLHAAQLAEATQQGKRLRRLKDTSVTVDGKLAVHSPSMSINDAVSTKLNLDHLDGPEEALNGSGSLKFGTFTGSARSPLTIKFDCRGSGHLDVDMETNMVVAGGDFNARMDNGKLSADGATGPIGALTHSTGEATCDSPVVKHVVQEQGKYWTDGICSKGFEIYSCRWESPEISYSYHIHLSVRALTATLTMTNPHVYLSHQGQLSVCNIGALAVADVVAVGGYSPGIDSPYPGLDNIVNGIIQFAFEPLQSVAASAIGTGVGWLVSLLATPAGNALCIGKPL